VNLDIGSPNTNRLVVVVAGDESDVTNLSGVTVDGNNCNLVTRANNIVGAGNHQEMWYCDEDNLGVSSGVVPVTISGGDAGWAVHAHLYTGAIQSGPTDFGIDETSSDPLDTVTVSGIDVPANGLVMMGAGHGSSGNWDNWTSPLTERTDGPDPSSTTFGTASNIESSARTNKTYIAIASASFNRGTGIVAVWPEAAPPVPRPDLRIQNEDFSPAAPVGGQTVTFIAQVINSGDDVAPSSPARLTIDSITISPDQSTGVLNVGQSSATFSWTWVAIEGSYNYQICADYNNTVPNELNEGNNCVGSGFTVSATPRPDLEVQNEGYLPASPLATQTVTFSADIVNNGTADAGSSDAQLIIDSSPVFPEQGTGVILSGGGSAYVELDWIAIEGSHTYQICADINGDVDESNEGNNCTAPPISIDVGAAPKPDLVIQNENYIPASPAAGQPMTFSASVVNIGSSSAGATSRTRLLIDSVPASSDQNTGNLDPSDQEPENWSWAAVEGSHTYQICADINDDVNESSNSNNCTAPAISFDVGPPPANLVDLDGWAWMDLPPPDGVAEGAGWIHFNGPGYSVKVENGTGLFSGYAWTSNYGWLSFNLSDLGGCPWGACEARMAGDYSVSGWGRFINAPDGDWEGWVSLADVINPIPLNGISYDRITGEFSGWAWVEDVGGWMSWNCNNPETAGACIASNYAVTDSGQRVNPNKPDPPTDPDTPGSGTPNVTELSQCTAPLQYLFNWAFTDQDVNDFQTAYQIEVFNDPGLSDLVHDSTKVISGSQQYSLPGGLLNYNSTYYWQVRVWDEGNNMSDWSEGDSFTTPDHAYPSVDFTWDPPAPSLLEPVDFFDASQGGEITGSPGNYYNIDSWDWSFEDGTPNASTTQNPVGVVFATGSQTKLIRLTVTDDSPQNFECYEEKANFFKPPLPEFREVVPRN
jgi:hypothetical protein